MVTVDLDAHIATLPNVKGGPNEDRYFLAYGGLTDKLEQAQTEAEERAWEQKIEARRARGLLFAVADGVGGAEMVVVLVSDGVYPKGFGSTREVREALAKLHRTPEVVASELVKRSRARRSRDDITALAFVVST